MAVYTGKNWREGDYISLAGQATEDGVWKEFDEKWDEILGGEGKRPKAPYLHMREANANEGPFSWRNGWNRKKVEALVVALLEHLQTQDKKRFHQFACSIDLRAHRKLITEGFTLPDPVDICNGHCPESVLVWYVTSYPGSLLISIISSTSVSRSNNRSRTVGRKRNRMFLIFLRAATTGN